MTGRPDLFAILRIAAHAGQETDGGIESVCIEMHRTPNLPPPYGLMPTANYFLAQPATTWPLAHIPVQRRLALWLLFLTLVTEQLLVAYCQFLAYPNPETWFPPLAWISSATGGMINGTLVAGVTLQLVLVLGILNGLGRLRPKELGLDLKLLWPAIQLTVLIWIACQVLHIAISLLMAKPIEVNPAWDAGSWRLALSEWLGQFFGNCPFEEVLFRGFLLPQCLLLAMHWLPESRRWKHMAIALLLSQGYFALGHVFFNIHQPQGQWLLIAQFIFGLLFAAIYLRTGNLFLAIGVHALINNPAPLLSDPLPGPGVTGSVVFVGCLLWLCVSLWCEGRYRSQQC
jgi:membrane protease YdiL (CAAX protease family)